MLVFSGNGKIYLSKNIGENVQASLKLVRTIISMFYLASVDPEKRLYIYFFQCLNPNQNIRQQNHFFLFSTLLKDCRICEECIQVIVF